MTVEDIMNGIPQTAATGYERVIALIADQLCREGMLRWPGTDGMTVEEVVLAAFRYGPNAVCLPTPSELTERHQELAADICRFFAAQDCG